MLFNDDNERVQIVLYKISLNELKTFEIKDLKVLKKSFFKAT